jgi:hypothetical protein
VSSQLLETSDYRSGSEKLIMRAFSERSRCDPHAIANIAPHHFALPTTPPNP